MLLRNLIDGLRLDYMPFCDQYTMPARETLHFLEGHPKRLLSLGDLVDIFSANFQSLLEHRNIHRVRSQLNGLRQDDLDKGTWLLRLGDVLSRRFWQWDQKDDLEEAIWYYEEALSLLPQTHYQFLEAILGFCSCVYQRFQLLGHLDDLKKLLEHLDTEQSLNLESLLTPVKAQLQLRPQVTHKFSDSKLRNQMMKNLSLNIPKASSNSIPHSGTTDRYSITSDDTRYPAHNRDEDEDLINLWSRSLYQCSWPRCRKSYSTLYNLNAHVTKQNHGAKRSPIGLFFCFFFFLFFFTQFTWACRI